MQIVLFIFLLFTFTSSATACSVLRTENFSSYSQQEFFCFRNPPAADGGFLIQGFDLEFNGSNNKPRILGVAHYTSRIDAIFTAESFLGVTPIEARTHFAVVMADQEADEDLTHSVLVGVHDIPLPIIEVQRQGCTGTCTIDAPTAWGNDSFVVLRGFFFIRDRGYDDNIRTIAIEPGCLIDGRSCFFDATYRDNDTREPYDVIVQYSVLPNSLAIGPSRHRIEARSDDAVRDSRRVTTRFRQDRANGATAMIQGFRFDFPDGDRFLGRIAIMPDEEAGATIVYRDGNDDGTTPKVAYDIRLMGLDQAALEPP